MDFNPTKFFKAATVTVGAFLFSMIFSVGIVIAADTKVDPVKQAAWEAAQADAIGRVSGFDEAVKSGSPEGIRKAGLELQSDPIAIQMMNQTRPDLVGAHNGVTGKIKADAKANIKENMAAEWNKAHPKEKPITKNDVEIYEPTNYKDPNAKAKSGQDWDVTVRVKGKDVPPAQSQKVVEKSYYEAAGGESTFGKRAPGVTKEQAAKAAAHKQAVEVTHGKSPEAYNEPDIILGSGSQKPQTGKALKDPEQLTHAIENKSLQARNKAEKAAAAGNMTEAATQEFEQMRQASKQYDKITKPRVEAAGGKVNAKVEKGMGVLRDAGAGKISPEQGRAKLAGMGETTESMIGKASSQAEAAQKFKKEPVSARTKAAKVAGAVMTGIDIGSTAEDVKENLKKGDVEGAAIVVGEAAANQVTGGAYGTVKATKEKYGDYTGAQEDTDSANRQNEIAYGMQVENALIKAKVSRAEVKKIMEAKANGDEAALERKFKQLGIKAPEKVVEKPVVGDDTVGERVVAIGAGMVENAKKTGKFLKEAAEDVTEITTGMMEKGVAKEVVSQTKENISDGLETFQENWNAGSKTANAKETLKARLIAKGATPEGAEKAAEALVQGDASKVRKLNALLDEKNKKKAEAEAAKNGSANTGWGSALAGGLQKMKDAAATGGAAVKAAYDKAKADAEKAAKTKAAADKLAADAAALKAKKEAADLEAKLDSEFEFTPENSSGDSVAKPQVASVAYGTTIAQFLGSWTGRFNLRNYLTNADDWRSVMVTLSTNEPPTREMGFNQTFHGTATVDGVVEYFQDQERLRWPTAEGYTISVSGAQRTFPCSFGNHTFSIDWTPLVKITRTWVVDGDLQTESEDIYFEMWGRIEDDGMFHGTLTPGGGKIPWEASRN